ncbi:MAG: hypothetical protein JXA82_06945 [Sedimentisphaerales bacterium]|nr:hypothetical protein [Sedimentisphaerales bacterium]
MIVENEIVAFVLAIAVLIFFISERVQLHKFPACKTFVATFCVCTAGWFFTVLEGMWVGVTLEWELNSLFNTIEHICYAASSLLFTLWCWKAFKDREVRS